MKDFEQHAHSKCNDEDTYWVFAAKYGKGKHSELKLIKWQSTVAQWVQTSSCIPKEWFAKNNFVHEVALWKDGTAMFIQHSTKIDILMCQFLETDANHLNQLNIYHALAAFPYNTVTIDILEVIKLLLICIYIYIYLYIYSHN